MSIISFAVTFIIVAVLVFLSGKIIHKFVSIIALGFINRLLGGIFGFLKTALVLSLILYFLAEFDTESKILKQDVKEESLLYDPVESIVPRIKDWFGLEDGEFPNPGDIDIPKLV